MTMPHNQETPKLTDAGGHLAPSRSGNPRAGMTDDVHVHSILSHLFMKAGQSVAQETSMAASLVALERR